MSLKVFKIVLETSHIAMYKRKLFRIRLMIERSMSWRLGKRSYSLVPSNSWSMNSRLASPSRFKMAEALLSLLTFLTIHSWSVTRCSSIFNSFLVSSSCFFSSPLLFLREFTESGIRIWKEIDSNWKRKKTRRVNTRTCARVSFFTLLTFCLWFDP